MEDNLFCEEDVKLMLKTYEINKSLVNLDLKMNIGLTSLLEEEIKRV